MGVLGLASPAPERIRSEITNFFAMFGFRQFLTFFMDYKLKLKKTRNPTKMGP